MYLTYEEYLAYGGTMPEPEFVVAEFKARSRIDWYTLARVQAMRTVPEAVKLAMMVIISGDAKYSVDAMAKGNSMIASFSTDGYSESYGSISEQSENYDKQVRKSIERMLFGVLDDNGVPLIYRGVD